MCKVDNAYHNDFYHFLNISFIGKTLKLCTRVYFEKYVLLYTSLEFFNKEKYLKNDGNHFDRDYRHLPMIAMIE